jgi:hypothetical protein
MNHPRLRRQERRQQERRWDYLVILFSLKFIVLLFCRLCSPLYYHAGTHTAYKQWEQGRTDSQVHANTKSMGDKCRE